MTPDQSDRDFAIDCINELDEYMKQLILKASTGPEGPVNYITHKTGQTINAARVVSVIRNDEHPVLEAMLAVRNKLTHNNGLSFENECIERLMRPVRGFADVRGNDDRQVFGLAYRELATRFSLRLGGAS